MKKEKIAFILWCICGVLAFFQFVTIPLYHHFFAKPKPIEWKWTEIPPKAYTNIPEHKGTTRTHYGNSVDTLQGGDTIYIYPKNNGFNGCGTLEFEIKIDSLSGATHGDLYIQESHFGLVWKPEDWLEIDGKDHVYINGSKSIGVTYSRETCIDKFRIMAVSPKWSNQKTRIELYYQYKPLI